MAQAWPGLFPPSSIGTVVFPGFSSPAPYPHSASTPTHTSRGPVGSQPTARGSFHNPFTNFSRCRWLRREHAALLLAAPGVGRVRGGAGGQTAVSRAAPVHSGGDEALFHGCTGRMAALQHAAAQALASTQAEPSEALTRHRETSALPLAVGSNDTE